LQSAFVNVLNVPGGYLKCTAAFKYIFQLNPVSANVLYGRCANRAGYQAQVFHTGVIVVNTKIHQVVPHLAGAGFYKNIIMANAVFYTADIKADNQPFKIG
jgi:hypothetical protein